MFKKILSILLVAVMMLAVSATIVSCDFGTDKRETIDSPIPLKDVESDLKVPDSFKIGFIFLHDENSTYDKNFLDAANRVKKALNLKDTQVIIKTNIGEDNNCYDAACELADKGCNIVFADSFGHEQYIIQAAKQYPNVQFCHATGTRAHTEGLDNYHNAFASIYEGRFLAGVAAGMKLNEMIKNGKITEAEAVMGYVGAFPYAEVKSGLTSFYLGAKYVCPGVTMKVQYTGSWYDEKLEREAATALISKGCKLISQHADSMGAPMACENAGVPNVSYNGSTIAACPETFIISSAINWSPYFLYIIDCYVNNKEIAKDWCGGIEEGSVILSDINAEACAEGTLDKLKEVIAAFKNGNLKVFDTNTFKVNGEKVTTYLADVDDLGDFKPETEVIKDGYFAESDKRSAPYFDLEIDGIEFPKAD